MTVGLFPGQGIAPRTVADSLPDDHELLESANQILGYDVKRRVEQVARLSRAVLPTRLAQPAIFIAGLISFEAAGRSGTTFDRLVGHSLGEYTALVAGGAIPFEHGIKLVAARGEAMQRASRRTSGGMVAVMGLTIEQAEEVARVTGLTLANDNSPSQAVLSGAEDALAEAGKIVRTLGGRSVLLPLDGAFHSPDMAPAADKLQATLVVTEVRSPAIPVISNVSAAPFRAPGEIRKLLVRQLTERVRFRESIAYVASRGADSFIDLGPGRIVGKLAEATVRALEPAHA